MHYRNRVTFIIPVFRLSQHRERNFWVTYNKIWRTGCPVIVIEQKTPQSNHAFEQKIQTTLPANVRYYSRVINDNKIHKSHLINFATNYVHTSHAWVNDIDAFMYFDEILNTIDFNQNFIKPFEQGVNASQEETQNICNDRPCKIDFDDKKRRHIHVYGALSFIYKVKEFRKLGSMSEKYTGWGLEDLDLHLRVSRLYDFHVLDHKAVHLWHPRPKRNDANFDVFKKQHPLRDKKIQSHSVTGEIHRAVDDIQVRIHSTDASDLNVQEFDLFAPLQFESTIMDRNQSAYEMGVKTSRVKRHNIFQTTRKIINNLSTDSTRVVRQLLKSNNVIVDQNETRVFHVINFLDLKAIKEQSVLQRYVNCLDSIDAADRSCASNIAITSDSVEHDQYKTWQFIQPSRDAKTVFGDTKTYVFINDMIEIALDLAQDDDFIFISNSDCMVTPHVYTNLRDTQQYDVVEYHRRDINPVYHYTQAYTSPYTTKITGIDGFAIRKKTYLNIVKQLYPNMVIGQPHWDTVLSGIVHAQNLKILKNTTDMYHEVHDQQWSTKDLSISGKHNQSRYDEAITYQVIKNKLINLTKKQTTIIVSDRAPCNKHVVNYCDEHKDHDIVLFEMLNPGDKSEYKDIKYINHVVIEHTTETIHVDQTYAMLNIAIIQNINNDKIITIKANDYNGTKHDVKSPTYFTTEGFYDVYKNCEKKLDYHVREDGLLVQCS